jgi:two-component system chemotaxis sensor kinase CheA
MSKEFEDRVAQISATVAQLREKAGDGRSTRQLLDILFRSVHSLKAAAHANDLHDLAARAHEFENLLHAFRTGRAELDDEVLRALDDAVTGFTTGASYPSIDLSEPVSSNTEGLVPAEIRNSLTEEERHRLAECVAENANLYLVETSFAVSDFDRQFQQLKEKLSETGEVIATSPKVESDKINFRILYSSDGNLSVLPGVTIRKLSDHLDRVLQQAVRAGQSVALQMGKQVDFIVRREEASLDKSACDALSDPLIHLVRNAVDHGIEASGQVVIEASETRITVTDDGRGIDPAILDLIFQPGFSTATEITEISGRGVGLDVVKTAVEQIGGTVTVSSTLGSGSTFVISLPKTD